MKLDCYFGVDSDEMFGINKYRLNLYRSMHHPDFNKKKIAYRIPNIPKLARFLNFLDFVSVSPFVTIMKRRKNAVAFIMSHSEAYLLNYFKFRKSAVLCYDLVPLLYKSTGLISRFKVWFAVCGMKKADIILTISDSVKKDVVKYLGYSAEKVFPIYGGIDPALYHVADEDLSYIKKRYDIPEGKRIILFLAAEEPRKNFPVVLKAFARLKERIPDLVVLKVGKPRVWGMRAQTMELIMELGIEKDVIFTDYVPEQDIPKIFNVADVVAYPTLYVSGISLPLMEAMACGCPVISTEFVRETIGDSPSMLYDATNVDELVCLLEKVLTDKAFNKGVVEHGLEQSKKFHWANTAKQAMEALWTLQ